MIVPCWVTREEALGWDAAYDRWRDAGTDHPTHAPDEFECRMECCWDYIKSMCMLAEGHGGEHEFVPQNQIVLVFR